MDQKRTNDIIADMTRQYKSTEEELTQQLSRLEQQEERNSSEIERLKEEYQRIKVEKET